MNKEEFDKKIEVIIEKAEQADNLLMSAFKEFIDCVQEEILSLRTEVEKRDRQDKRFLEWLKSKGFAMTDMDDLLKECIDSGEMPSCVIPKENKDEWDLCNVANEINHFYKEFYNAKNFDANDEYIINKIANIIEKYFQDRMQEKSKEFFQRIEMEDWMNRDHYKQRHYVNLINGIFKEIFGIKE